MPTGIPPSFVRPQCVLFYLIRTGIHQLTLAEFRKMFRNTREQQLKYNITAMTVSRVPSFAIYRPELESKSFSALNQHISRVKT